MEVTISTYASCDSRRGWDGCCSRGKLRGTEEIRATLDVLTGGLSAASWGGRLGSLIAVRRFFGGVEGGWWRRRLWGSRWFVCWVCGAYQIPFVFPFVVFRFVFCLVLRGLGDWVLTCMDAYHYEGEDGLGPRSAGKRGVFQKRGEGLHCGVSEDRIVLV